jgi:hypothetical protein
MNDTLKVTQGNLLLLADKWANIRVKKKEIWRVPIVAGKVKRNALTENEICWLISIARTPGQLRHGRIGQLESLFQLYPSEVSQLLAWADDTFRKQTFRKGQRTRMPEVIALRTTLLAAEKEDGCSPHATQSEIKNADKQIAASVRRAAKSTDAKV